MRLSRQLFLPSLPPPFPFFLSVFLSLSLLIPNARGKRWKLIKSGETVCVVERRSRWCFRDGTDVGGGKRRRRRGGYRDDDDDDDNDDDDDDGGVALSLEP